MSLIRIEKGLHLTKPKRLAQGRSIAKVIIKGISSYDGTKKIKEQEQLLLV